ncbi:hypothetical protein BC739_007937 [Kutzneria viridogrisea]|uniref:Uncharacterized protein n=1 Tax=Kutzneria viridogrisea TaxID=47990 RepID=A0ABR6BVI2_9PSEU|nr:hypothetical protein [Kutzneria viridogrisea]
MVKNRRIQMRHTSQSVTVECGLLGDALPGRRERRVAPGVGATLAVRRRTAAG